MCSCGSLLDKVVVVCRAGRVTLWVLIFLLGYYAERCQKQLMNCAAAYEPQWGPVGRLWVCDSVHMGILGGLLRRLR